MACSHSQRCQLFPQLAADPGLKLWQQHYCESDYTHCARYQSALSGKVVPLALLPNGKQLHHYCKQDEMAASALFNAIQKDRVHMVKSLVNGKISSELIHMVDGTTPLMAAAGKGNKEIVKLLLEAGCSPLHKNAKGETAGDIAQRAGHFECLALIRPFMQRHMNTASRQQEEKPQTSVMSDVLSFLRKLNPAR